MKTIIMTIKTPHLCNIRRGTKKYEVRKTSPSIKPPFRVLLCESCSGGKIKAEFVCDYVRCAPITGKGLLSMPAGIMPDECCLRWQELVDYSNGKPLYLWHVSEVIDYCSTKGQKVRNISEFGLNRTPQSWQYLKMDAEVEG